MMVGVDAHSAISYHHWLFGLLLVARGGNLQYPVYGSPRVRRMLHSFHRMNHRLRTPTSDCVRSGHKNGIPMLRY